SDCPLLSVALSYPISSGSIPAFSWVAKERSSDLPQGGKGGSITIPRGPSTVSLKAGSMRMEVVEFFYKCIYIIVKSLLLLLHTLPSFRSHLDRKAAALRSMNLCLLGRSPIQAAVSRRPQHKQKVPAEGGELWLHRSIQWF
ncbi:hypothetical protein MJT46_017278, partial [Ovis ammon polii x Ovis aries]